MNEICACLALVACLGFVAWVIEHAEDTAHQQLEQCLEREKVRP